MDSDGLRKMPPEVATELVFLRAANAWKAAVVVEGASDVKLFERMLDFNCCDIVSADGKDNALEVTKELVESEFDGFVVLIDRDYDEILGNNYESGNVFYSDENDVDVMLFRSQALDAVLGECGSRSKVDAKGGADAVREAIVLCAQNIGALRLHSHLKGLNLKFSEMSLDCVCRNSLSIGIERLVQGVFNRSRLPQPCYEEHVERVGELTQSAVSPWSLCQGHDLVAVLSKALQGYCGSCRSTDSRIEWVARSLRLAYTRDEFSRTSLYGKLQAWEWSNAPFRVLA